MQKNQTFSLKENTGNKNAIPLPIVLRFDFLKPFIIRFLFKHALVILLCHSALFLNQTSI